MEKILKEKMIKAQLPTIEIKHVKNLKKLKLTP
jgi:hypothetical protein